MESDLSRNGHGSAEGFPEDDAEDQQHKYRGKRPLLGPEQEASSSGQSCKGSPPLRLHVVFPVLCASPAHDGMII